MILNGQKWHNSSIPDNLSTLGEIAQHKLSATESDRMGPAYPELMGPDLPGAALLDCYNPSDGKVRQRSLALRLSPSLLHQGAVPKW